MYYVKNVSERDLPEILAIEKKTYPMPWDEKAFKCEISKFRSGVSLFFVAKCNDDDSVAGYAAGDFIVDYLHITNIAVREDMRKKGIAADFLKRFESEAGKRGFLSLTLEVRATNTPAIALYKKAGYYERGIREKFYENKDDGLIMWKKL